MKHYKAVGWFMNFMLMLGLALIYLYDTHFHESTPYDDKIDELFTPKTSPELCYNNSIPLKSYRYKPNEQQHARRMIYTNHKTGTFAAGQQIRCLRHCLDQCIHFEWRGTGNVITRNWRECDEDTTFYFVQFLRDPYDMIVSAYLYHSAGMEGWTRKKLDEGNRMYQYYQTNVERVNRLGIDLLPRGDDTVRSYYKKAPLRDGLIFEILAALERHGTNYLADMQNILEFFPENYSKHKCKTVKLKYIDIMNTHSYLSADGLLFELMEFFDTPKMEQKYINMTIKCLDKFQNEIRAIHQRNYKPKTAEQNRTVIRQLVEELDSSLFDSRLHHLSKLVQHRVSDFGTGTLDELLQLLSD